MSAVCSKCGLPNPNSMDNSGIRPMHRHPFRVNDGCVLELFEEVKRLREEIDWLRDLVVPNG